MHRLRAAGSMLDEVQSAGLVDCRPAQLLREQPSMLHRLMHQYCSWAMSELERMRAVLCRGGVAVSTGRRHWG